MKRTKMSSRTIALLLVVAMLLSSGLPVFAATEENVQVLDEEETLPFSDVKVGDWYYEAVRYVYEIELFDGMDNGLFEPDTALTREMFVTVLARQAGNMDVDTSGYTQDFEDVPGDEWYSEAIAWGAENELVEGYDNETFGLGDKITREQMAALFYRFAEYLDVELPDDAETEFGDADKISDWAVEAVEATVAAGLFEGDDYGNFGPTESATRAQAATVFMRFAVICEPDEPEPSDEPSDEPSGEPSDPTPSGDPVDPTPTQSVEPTPTQPVEPTPTQPVEPTPTQPVEPTPTQPVEPTPELPVDPDLPDLPGGAEFNALSGDEIGMTGSEAFVYVPSETYNPSPMMTPIIYVYSDNGYADREDAWGAMCDLGLMALAEAEMAVVILVNPLGATWSEEDVAVNERLQYYVYSDNSDGLAITYLNLQYAIGEGAGADFINEYLVKEANIGGRLAGVATFGGTADTLSAESDDVAMPAYISNGTSSALAYYQAVNETGTNGKTVDGNTVYTNSIDPAKEVVVSGSGNSVMTADGIDDAYYSLFRWTTRMFLTERIFYGYYDKATANEIPTLERRPNAETLDLTVNYEEKTLTNNSGSSNSERWYEWVPNEALAADNTDEYPLVLVLHGGGDHPIFESEFQGWVDVAGEERVFLLTPFSTGTNADRLMAMLDYMFENYPIDQSRVYVTGFSMGTGNTNRMIESYPEVFAAASPMAFTGGTSFDISPGSKAEQYELPILFLIGAGDLDVLDDPDRGTSYRYREQRFLEKVMQMNNITPPLAEEKYDHDTYGIWGFPIEEGGLNYTTIHGFEVSSGQLYGETAGYPMLRLTQVSDLNHTHYMEYAGIAWEYLSQFQRDLDTKDVIWLEAEEDDPQFFTIGDDELNDDELKEKLGIELNGSEAFVYVASELYDPGPMLTPVFYVYADSAFADETEALAYLEDYGLIDLAEEEHGVILLANPLSGTWSADDVDVYTALTYYVYSDYTWLNLQYAIGEGSGADFIHEHLTQNADRIAAVATFGGSDSITMPNTGVAVPAYIVDGNDDAIQYYRDVNGATRTQSGGNVYYNPNDDVKKVIVDDESQYNAEGINTAYYTLLRWTTRMTLETTIFDDFFTGEVFTLLARPDIDELGLVREDYYSEDPEAIAVDQDMFFVWLPEEALDEDNEETFPLVFTFHGGGDHPIFEAESNGWVALAGEERFIVVSPESNSLVDSTNMTGDEDLYDKLLDYMIENYPVDESRVYATGFSRGSSETNWFAMTSADRLAAVVPMATANGNLQATNTDLNGTVVLEEYEIPYMYLFGTNETHAIKTVRGTTDTYLYAHRVDPREEDPVYPYTQVESALIANNIPLPYEDLDDYDLETYPWWGFELDDNWTGQTLHGYQVNSGYMRNAAGVPMVQLTYIDGTNHAHYTEYAAIAWDFMSQFSRNADGSVEWYADNNYPGQPEGSTFSTVGKDVLDGYYRELDETIYDLSADTTAYVYTPSAYLNNDFMTPVVYVYSETGYATEVEAWNAMIDLGLVDIAEEEYGVVILVNPTDGAWGEDDVEVYTALTHYVFNPGETGYYENDYKNVNALGVSYLNLQYIIAEGDGADFVNTYITTTDAAKRIAGVATFGGTVDDFSAANNIAVPAYISGGTTGAIQYYQTANGTAASGEVDGNGNTVYTNDSDTVKQVVVNTNGGSSLTAELVDEAYYSVFRWTSRAALENRPWKSFFNDEDYTLLPRPNVDELELTFTSGYGGTNGLYLWAPDEADTAEAATYPLVLVLPGGGDHPIYEAESQGWVQAAGEESFFVMSTTSTQAAGIVNQINQVLEANPAIDESRIYLSGFSRGTRVSTLLMQDYADMFAAASPMAMTGGVIDASGIAVDLPIIYIMGSNDEDANVDNPMYYHAFLDQVKLMNGITPTYNVPPTSNARDWGDLDFDNNHYYWGFNIENESSYTNIHGFEIETGELYADDVTANQVPMLSLALAVNLNHTHYTEYAGIAWDYVSQFSRDTDTKEIIWDNNGTEVRVPRAEVEVVVRGVDESGNELYSDVGPTVTAGKSYTATAKTVDGYVLADTDANDAGEKTIVVSRANNTVTFQYKYDLPEGANFFSIGEAELGIADSEVFVYTPSEVHSPSPMLTPVIYVYSDTKLASDTQAWRTILDLGLVDLAEEEMGVALLVNPLDETWGADDIAVYNALNYYLYSSNRTLGVYTYLNLQYAIGEGSGADFINTHLSQNADRLAAVATFGGTVTIMPDTNSETAVPLPAYIVDGTAESVDYYKTVNGTDKNDGNVDYNEVLPVQKVIVDDNLIYDADGIETVFYDMFRWTSRMSIETAVYDDYYAEEVFKLVERPNLEALDMTMILVDGDEADEVNQSRYYVWVPNEAIDENHENYDPDAEIPLVFDIHGGGDHPIFEAEFNGWVALAGEERFIIVSPEDGAAPGNFEPHPDPRTYDLLFERIFEEYPLDMSRLYATGFSRGSKETNFLTMYYTDIFAAMAPMESADGMLASSDPWIDYYDANYGEGYIEFKADQYDIPWLYLYGTKSYTHAIKSSNGDDYSDESALYLHAQDFVRAAMEINDIAEAENEPDYDTYRWIGYPLEDTFDYTTPHGIELTTGYMYNEDGVPMIQITEVEGVQHTHYTEYAAIAWDFLSQYTRNTTDGSVEWNGSN